MSIFDDSFDEVGDSLKTVLFVLILFAGIVGGGYFIYKWSAPRYEEVRHDTYENSTAYIRGKAEHLQRLKLQYETAKTDDHKKAIRQAALTEVVSFDTDKLPEDLRNWINQIK